MKAIFEFEMPNSCRECKLNTFGWTRYKEGYTKDGNISCIALGTDGINGKCIYVQFDEKSKLCPLKIASNEKQNEWINVEDGLPYNNREVLCKNKYGQYLIATYNLYYIDDDGMKHYSWNSYDADPE